MQNHHQSSTLKCILKMLLPLRKGESLSISQSLRVHSFLFQSRFHIILDHCRSLTVLWSLDHPPWLRGRLEKLQYFFLPPLNWFHQNWTMLSEVTIKSSLLSPFHSLCNPCSTGWEETSPGDTHQLHYQPTWERLFTASICLTKAESHKFRSPLGLQVQSGVCDQTL